jgi:hypothetical protein
MTAPTGTQQSYQAIGNKEDFADVIYDISPTKYPFQSNVGRGSCSSKYKQWQTDSLDAATADNITIEGDDATNNTASPTVMLGNYTQLSDKVAQVSTSQEAIDSYGRKSDMSYQLMKRAKEVKRDVEARLCSNQAAAAGDATTGRECAGIGAWLWNNKVDLGTANTTVTVTSGAPTTDPTAGTAATLTEANLKTAIQYCWTDGGEPNMVLCGAHNKQLISAFTGIATQYRDNPQAGPATIIGAADIYVSDFGTVNIVPSHFTPATEVFVLDTSTWEVLFLQPYKQEPLAKTGHSIRRMVSAEYTLKANSPEANAKIGTTTTS